MKSFIAFLIMVVWSTLVYVAMHFLGFSDQAREFSAYDSMWIYLGQNLGAAVLLLIGLIANVWIYFLVVGEQPWQWGKEKD